MTTSNHTPITGTPQLQTAMNTALGELDSAIGGIGLFNVATLADIKTNGDEGGGATGTTWNTRTLNTEVDADGIVSISSNQFTPAAGTYVLLVQGDAYDVTMNRIRLYNATQTSVVFTGFGGLRSDTVLVNNTPFMAIFTANGTDAYEIQHYTAVTRATDGFGISDLRSSTECYLQAILYRIGL